MLNRAVVDKTHINGLRSAFNFIFQSERTFMDAIKPTLDLSKVNPLVEDMISFITSATSRSLTISSKD